MSAHLPLPPSTAPILPSEEGVNHFTFFESDQPGLEGAVTHITVMEGEGEDQIKVKREEGEEASKIPATLKFPYNAPQPLVELLQAVWRQDLDSINALKRSVSINANCMGITLAAVIMRHLAITKTPIAVIENMKQFLFNLGVNERECLDGLIWGGYYSPEYLRDNNISNNPSRDAYYALAGGHQVVADVLISKLSKPLSSDHYACLALGAIAGGNLEKMMEYESMLKDSCRVNKAALEQILGERGFLSNNSDIQNNPDIRTVMSQHAGFFNHREIVQQFAEVCNFRLYALKGAIAAGRLDSINAYEAESYRIDRHSIFAGIDRQTIHACFKFTVQHGQKDLVWPLIEMHYCRLDRQENTKIARMKTLTSLKEVVDNVYPYMRDYLNQLEKEKKQTKKSALKASNCSSNSSSSKTQSPAAASSAYSSSSSACSSLSAASSASAFLPAFSDQSSKASSLGRLSLMLNSSRCSSSSSHSSSGEGQHFQNMNTAELTARVIQLEQTVEQQNTQLQKQETQLQKLMRTIQALEKKLNAPHQQGESEDCHLIDSFPSSKGIKRKLEQ